MMHVAVVGSRNFAPMRNMVPLLETFRSDIFGDFTLVSGGAEGVDKAAEKWAKSVGLPTKIFPADWERDGKRAGVMRNGAIISNAQAVIVFWDGVSTGTLDSICRAKKSKEIPDDKIFIYLG